MLLNFLFDPLEQVNDLSMVVGLPVIENQLGIKFDEMSDSYMPM